MVEVLITIAICCLLIIAGGVLLAIRRFYRSLANSRQEREAWQQAQEGRQRAWEVRQGKHILDAEKKLADQLKDARREWRDWNFQIRQDQQEWRDSVDLEKALARLPHVEQLELASQDAGERVPPKDWRPPTFYKADLRGRDLSYRYMVRTDLREVQLMEANLYMADLTGVSLAGADLQQANLIGANLSGADLRGANLSGANLMVADLHNTVLHGANLTGACNLTADQLQMAIYDSTTLIDSNIDITLPRIRSVATTTPNLLSAAAASEPRSSEITPISGEGEDHTSIANAEQPAESETSITEFSATTDENTVLSAESSASLPEELAVPQEQANVASDPRAEQNADALTSPGENAEVLPESPMPTSETSQKRSASRKRSSKPKQAATSIQTFSSIQEDADVNMKRKTDTTQESEEIEEEEEEILPNKIIQWPTRAPKTSPLPNTSEQNNGEKTQKNRGNNPTASMDETLEDSKNQRAQAN
ncbi:MAG TPA: pentapeptide repeat-containing protein [Ktedonobacteraceae bacterium]